MMGVALACSVWSPSSDLVWRLLMAGFVVTGVPHGVFDIDLARWAAGRRWSGYAASSFFTLYISLALIVVAGWAIAPSLTLVAFLSASVWHFGFGDMERRPGGPLPNLCVGLSQGLTPVVLPCVIHPSTAASLFAALAGRTASQVEAVLLDVRPYAFAVWAACFLLATVSLAKRSEDRALLLASIGAAAMFMLAPPLLAFAVYFCGAHAVRHIFQMTARSGVASVAEAMAWTVWRIVPAAAVTALALGLAARFYPVASPGLVSLAFRALAALTLPHLILTPWLEGRAAANGYTLQTSPT